jgi:hypothetical protein
MISQHLGKGITEEKRAGTMPCDGAWPAERVDAFERWATSGMAP